MLRKESIVKLLSDYYRENEDADLTDGFNFIQAYEEKERKLLKELEKEKR